MQWEAGKKQDQDGGETDLKEFFFLLDLGIKTDTDFQGREKHREFILETGSPGTKCLHCDLEEVKSLSKLWGHHLQNWIIDTCLADEAYVLHQRSACGCCINDRSYDILLPSTGKQEARASAEGKQGDSGLGSWGK